MSNNRGMSSALTTTTKEATVQYYEIVHIDVNSGYYLTNAPWDIIYDGITYYAAGNMLELDGVEENVGFEIESLNVIKFSFPRKVIQGHIHDRDMHGAQLAVLLSELRL